MFRGKGLEFRVWGLGLQDATAAFTGSAGLYTL